ncbi:MAG: hypothetical protein ACI80V_003741 [Rhodothermales bacterium]|jgi:uncharacterized protein YdeI (YjbR/CyaY-like superfamily)
MPEVNPAKTMPFVSSEDLSEWLEANHATESELWAKVFKKKSGLPSVNWNDIVIETLRWGWIDGVKKSLDDQSSQYAIASGLMTAKKPETRQGRFEKFVDMLNREEKPGFGFKKKKA